MLTAAAPYISPNERSALAVDRCATGFRADISVCIARLAGLHAHGIEPRKQIVDRWRCPCGASLRLAGEIGRLVFGLAGVFARRLSSFASSLSPFRALRACRIPRGLRLRLRFRLVLLAANLCTQSPESLGAQFLFKRLHNEFDGTRGGRLGVIFARRGLASLARDMSFGCSS